MDVNNNYIVHRIEVKDVFNSNAYIFANRLTKQAMIIDAGAQPEKIIKVINDNEYSVEKILLTHGHFDHIAAVDDLRREFNVPVYMHHRGIEYTENAVRNLSALCERFVVLKDVNYVGEGTTFQLENDESSIFTMHYTLGHATDQVMYYNQQLNISFVGDTIFKGTFGSTQYEGGNKQDLIQSIAKILSLPDDTILYSGHTPDTTVGAEKVWYM